MLQKKLRVTFTLLLCLLCGFAQVRAEKEIAKLALDPHTVVYGESIALQRREGVTGELSVSSMPTQETTRTKKKAKTSEKLYRADRTWAADVPRLVFSDDFAGEWRNAWAEKQLQRYALKVETSRYDLAFEPLQAISTGLSVGLYDAADQKRCEGALRDGENTLTGATVAQEAHGTGAVLLKAGAFVGQGVLRQLVATAAAEGDNPIDIHETLNGMEKPSVNVGLIIGIAVAVVAVIAAVVVVLFVLKKRKPTQDGSIADSGSDDTQSDVSVAKDDPQEETNSIYNPSQMRGEHPGSPVVNPMPPLSDEDKTIDPYAQKTPDEDETINPWAKKQGNTDVNISDEEKTIAPDFAVQVPAFEMHLVVHEKNERSRYTLTMEKGEQVKIGRSKKSRIILSEPYVSREHLEIVAQEEGLMLRNLKAEEKASAKYTQINGAPFAEQVIDLSSGDVVEIKGDDSSTLLVITQVRVGNQAR